MSKQFLTDTHTLSNYNALIRSFEDTIYCFAEKCVCYQIVNLTIPANCSIELNAKLKKQVSMIDVNGKAHDYYDIMTNFDSNLTFTEQTLEVIGANHLVFAEETSGIELENGIYTIPLKEDFFEIVIKQKR